MAGLQDYLLSNTSIADFIPEERVASVGNQKSKTNLAANIAFLSEDPVGTFTRVSEELDSGRDSPTKQSLLNELDLRAERGNKEFLMDFLAKDDVPDEEKLAVATEIANGKRESTEHDRVSEKLLNQPDGVFTEEGFVTRDSTIALFQEANKYRNKVNAVKNSQALISDQSTMKILASVGEVLLPYVDQALVGQIATELAEMGIESDTGRAKSFLLLGTSKLDLQKAYTSMTLDKRMMFLQGVVEAVQGNDGIVLDDNALRTLDYLSTIVETGEYGQVDRIIDDVVSLTEAISLLPILRTAKKAVKGGGKRRREAILGEEVDDVIFPEGVDDVVFPRDKSTPAPRRDKKDIELDSSKGEVDYEDVTVKSVKTEVIPTSPYENLKQNNKGSYDAIYRAILEDTSGELARVAAGTTRTDIVADANLPAVKTEAGVIPYQSPHPGSAQSYSINPRQTRTMDEERGVLQYYPHEKAAERALVINDFQNATGMTLRTNLSSFKGRDDGLDISVVYGGVNNGWANAQTALDLAKFHLRDYGIRDDHVKVLQRTPRGYEPVEVTPDMPLGDYLVEVNYPFRFSAKRGKVSSKRGDTMITQQPDDSLINQIFEGAGVGGLKDSILTAESFLDERLMSAAFVATDQSVGIEKAIIDLVKDFKKQYFKLSGARKKVFTQALADANANGIEYTRSFAANYNMSGDEYDLLQKFKEVQDELYWMENEDFIVSLRSQGYGLWSDGVGTELIAKPLGRTQVASVKALDPQTNLIVDMGKNKLTDLYNQSGEIAELKSSMNINGVEVKHIISRNSVSGGYMRSLNIDDRVLNYRPGYYKVVYKDPKFILESLPDGGYRVVATAPDIKAAELMARRMEQTNPGRAFFHRDDYKSMKISDEDASFDMAMAQGRSSQKYRGSRLMDSNSVGQPISSQHIMDPLEVMKQGAMSVASRVSMRDTLDSMKVRLFETYKDVMPVEQGRSRMPLNAGEIKGNKPGMDKRVNAARSLYRYIDSLEAANTTFIGQRWFALMNQSADFVGWNIKGRAGTSMEGVLRATSNVDPAGAITKAGFLAYIATNPLSQLITQAAGAFVSIGLRPQFLARPNGLIAQATSMYWHRMGFEVSDNMLKFMSISRSDWNELTKQWERSGLPFAADANNLIRFGSSTMSERGWVDAGAGVKHYLWDKPIQVASKGFDEGEYLNMMVAFLTHADEARANGKLSGAEAYEEVAAKARNSTLGMNRAAQPGYQRTELRVPFQFLQVTTKAYALMFTNRMLTKKQKISLALTSTALFGSQVWPALTSAVEDMTKDWTHDPTKHEAKRMMEEGMFSWAINKMLTLAAGEAVHLDIAGRTNPFNYEGQTDRIAELLFDQSVVDFFAEAPSAQVFGKMGAAIHQGLKLINLKDEELPEDPTELAGFLRSVGSISSGFSNTFKSQMAYRYGKAYSGSGYMTDAHVSNVEAIAKAFGFQTMDEARSFGLRESLWGKTEKEAPDWNMESDVEEWYKLAKQNLFYKKIPTDSDEAMQKILGSMGNKLFSDYPRNVEHLLGLVNRDARNNNDRSFISGVMFAMDAGMDSDKLKVMINKLPNISREEKANLLTMIDQVDSLSGE